MQCTDDVHTYTLHILCIMYNMYDFNNKLAVIKLLFKQTNLDLYRILMYKSKTHSIFIYYNMYYCSLPNLYSVSFSIYFLHFLFYHTIYCTCAIQIMYKKTSSLVLTPPCSFQSPHIESRGDLSYTHNVTFQLLYYMYDVCITNSHFSYQET